MLWWWVGDGDQCRVCVCLCVCVCERAHANHHSPPGLLEPLWVIHSWIQMKISTFRYSLKRKPLFILLFLECVHCLVTKGADCFNLVQFIRCRLQLFATPWTAARQASLSITNSQSLLKLMSIESVVPSSHLIFVVPFSSCLQCFPASGSFQMSQFFASGGQSTGVSASASVLPMNKQIA